MKITDEYLHIFYIYIMEMYDNGGIYLEGQSTAALFEHRFWLQIMGDHARFIFFSLAPSETEHIREAQRYIEAFDQLLKTVRQTGGTEAVELNRQVYDTTYAFRKFKLQLLALTLRNELKVHLSSTFFNHMLNELEAYLLTINNMQDGESPVFHPLHYSTLWLSDAIGHAASVASNLDAVEKDFIELAGEFEKQFTDLYIKTLEASGYMRTNMNDFPALDRLNQQSGVTTNRFKDFLEQVLRLRSDGTLLGTLMPLMADHMAREECYYLTKLSQSADNISSPDCDPAKPRVEG